MSMAVPIVSFEVPVLTVALSVALDRVLTRVAVRVGNDERVSSSQLRVPRVFDHRVHLFPGPEASVVAITLPLGSSTVTESWRLEVVGVATRVSVSPALRDRVRLSTSVGLTKTALVVLVIDEVTQRRDWRERCCEGRRT